FSGVESSLALAVLGLILLAICLGPEIWTHDPEAIDLTNKYAGFSWSSPLGTDDFGRDILARLLHGGRLTFLGAFAVLLGCSAVGLLVGAFAGFSGGKLDSLLGRVMEAFLSLPSLVIALGLIGVLGKSFTHLLVALIATGWPWYARIYRSLV